MVNVLTKNSRVRDLEAQMVLGLCKAKNRLAKPFMNKRGDGDERTTVQKILHYAPIFVTVLIMTGVLLMVTGAWPAVRDKLQEFITKWTTFNFS